MKENILRFFIYISYIMMIICGSNVLGKILYGCEEDKLTDKDKIYALISYVSVFAGSLLILILYFTSIFSKDKKIYLNILTLVVALVLFLTSSIYLMEVRNYKDDPKSYIIGTKIFYIIAFTYIIVWDLIQIGSKKITNLITTKKENFIKDITKDYRYLLNTIIDNNKDFETTKNEILYYLNEYSKKQ